MSSQNQVLISSLIKVPNHTEEPKSPLLKNLSWSRLPTIIKEPLPPPLSLLCCAARSWPRHSRSIKSKAGINPLLMSSWVRRLSCPLWSSIIHSEGFAKQKMAMYCKWKSHIWRKQEPTMGNCQQGVSIWKRGRSSHIGHVVQVEVGSNINNII